MIILDQMPMTKTRKLSTEDSDAIRSQIEDGVPREIIAAELSVSLKQIDGLRAHLTSNWYSPEELVVRAYRYAAARARARGEDYLTKDECLEIAKSQRMRCDLSGQKFSNKRSHNNAKILACPLRPSLDRRKPKLGYTKSNTRLVTQWANFARGEWTDGFFVKMCKTVAAREKVGRQ
jgi:hypothetical protein